MRPLALVLALVLLPARPAGGKLAYLSSYDYDPAAQHGWLTLGKTDNLTLLLHGWETHRIPALIELGKSGPDDLWCFSGPQNTSNPLIPCGGRGSATFAARLAAFGVAMKPHLESGACAGAFLGDELMAAWDLSWEDLCFVSDGLRQVLGPKALLYENDAFHQGLLDMPRVPPALNFFSADGDCAMHCSHHHSVISRGVSERVLEISFPPLLDFQGCF